MWSPTIVLIVTLIGHIGLCHVFTNWYEMDVKGIAYAYTISSFNLLVIMSLYQNCCLTDIGDALFCPGAETYEDSWEYIKLVLSSILATIGE